MEIEARGTNDFTLSVNLLELQFLVDAMQGILAVLFTGTWSSVMPTPSFMGKELPKPTT